MCVIVDACCISRVFNSDNSEHNAYKPVLQWIEHGSGFLVYGGTKYMEELSKLKKYRRLFIAYSKDPSKARRIDDRKVDMVEKRIEKIIPDKKFNDKHLAAIAHVAKCMIICTTDKKCKKYVQDKRLYPRDMSIPRLYTKLSNANILTDGNIHSSYK